MSHEAEAALAANGNHYQRASMAELSVAACILCEPTETLPSIREILTAGDFYTEGCRSVFRAACELADNGKPVDPVTIQSQAEEMGVKLSSDWLRDVMGAFITTANVAANAALVKGYAVKRAAEDVGISLSSGELTAQAALERLHDILSGQRTALPTPSEDATVFYRHLIDATEGKKRPFLSTGFAALDDVLGGGLVQSGLITLAARPGIGKTVMALCIADNVAANGGRVLYESLEMSREQLWARRVARRTGVSYSQLQNGSFGDGQNKEEQWRRVMRSVTELSKTEVIISDANARLDDIERHVRAAGKLDLVVVDHMGFIISDAGKDGLYGITTEVAHRLKRLAKATGVPILMLCQLNRVSESRQDKRPWLSDLRNSGSIEEDSDAVIGLYREDYYKPEAERPRPWEPQTMEAIVLKNRHDGTGTCYFEFMGAISDVRDIRSDGDFRETREHTPFDT